MSSCWDTNTKSYENEEYTILWHVTPRTLVEIYYFWQICSLHLIDTVVGSRWRQQVSPKRYFSTRLYCISPYKTVFIATRTSSLTILMKGNIKLLLIHFLSCTFMTYSTSYSHLTQPWNAKELYVCNLQIEHQSCHGEFLQISSLWSSSRIISLWYVRLNHMFCKYSTPNLITWLNYIRLWSLYMADTCECDNEPLGSIKCGKFFY